MRYYIYGRLGVHVAAPDSELMDALDCWASMALKDGVAGVTPELREGIRSEHRYARDLYMDVMHGTL